MAWVVVQLPNGLPKLVVVGSNPIARSTPPCVLVGFETHGRGFRKGRAPFVGSARGGCPLSGSCEASFRAEPATECGSNPIARSNPVFVHFFFPFLLFTVSTALPFLTHGSVRTNIAYPSPV